jgi:hypothetical protein
MASTMCRNLHINKYTVKCESGGPGQVVGGVGRGAWGVGRGAKDEGRGARDEGRGETGQSQGQPGSTIHRRRTAMPQLSREIPFSPFLTHSLIRSLSFSPRPPLASSFKRFQLSIAYPGYSAQRVSNVSGSSLVSQYTS